MASILNVRCGDCNKAYEIPINGFGHIVDNVNNFKITDVKESNYLTSKCCGTRSHKKTPELAAKVRQQEAMNKIKEAMKKASTKA